MIALVVCLILLAGFLDTQATATGIAHNERDFQECKSLAQSGIDMCVWQMKNCANWREVMPVGNWLSNQPIGSGTVSVSVADATNSFTDDNTQPVTLTSTATYNTRTCTLTAIVTPTGGGTVFGNGIYSAGQVTVGDGGGATCSIDSYDSSLAAYNSFRPGSSALLNINSSSAGALTLNGFSAVNGSATFPPGALLTSAVNLVHGYLGGPSSESNAAETRTPGIVISTNTTGLPTRSAINQTFNQTYSGSATYPSITINTTNPSTTLTFGASVTIYVTGNLIISSYSTLQVNDGCNVTLRVDGNVTISGNIKLNSTGQLTLICNQNVTINSSASVNANSANTTSAFMLEGTPNCTSIHDQNNAVVMGGIFAPAAALEHANYADLYGAAVGRFHLLAEHRRPPLGQRHQIQGHP